MARKPVDLFIDSKYCCVELSRQGDDIRCFALLQVSTLSPPVLEVMDVDFKYPTGPTILKNVNFGLDQTSRVCIVGPNGAGKDRSIIKANRD